MGTTGLAEVVSIMGFFGTGGAGLRVSPVDEDPEEAMLSLLEGLMLFMYVTIWLSSPSFSERWFFELRGGGSLRERLRGSPSGSPAGFLCWA